MGAAVCCADSCSTGEAGSCCSGFCQGISIEPPPCAYLPGGIDRCCASSPVSANRGIMPTGKSCLDHPPPCILEEYGGPKGRPQLPATVGEPMFSVNATVIRDNICSDVADIGLSTAQLHQIAGHRPMYQDWASVCISCGRNDTSVMHW